MRSGQAVVRVDPPVAADDPGRDPAPSLPDGVPTAAGPGLASKEPVVPGHSVSSTLWGLVRGHRVIMATGMVLALLSAGAGVAQPRILQVVVNGLVGRANVTQSMVLLAAAIAVQAIATSVQAYLVAKGAEAAVLDLRRRLAAKYLSLTVGEHDRGNTADFLSRAVNDAQLVKALIATGVVPVVAALVMLVAIIGVMVLLNPLLFAVTAGFVLVGAVFVRLIGATARRSSAAVQDAVANYGVAVERLLAGIRSVKAFSAEAAEQRNSERYASSLQRAGLRLARVQATVQPILNLCLYGCLLAVVVVSAAMLSTGRLDLGGFAAYLMYLFMLITPISSLGQAYSQIQVGFAAVGRLRELDALTEEGTGRDPAGQAPHDGHPGSPVLSLHGVQFEYEPGTPVLHGLDMAFHRGEKVVVVGPSGSGKSTFLDLLERFYEPDGGEIRFRGVDYRQWDPRAYRCSLALVPQDCQIVTGTLRENLTMGRTDISDERLHQVLRRLGLDALLDNKAGSGLDNDLGQHGGLLSGGQRQRVAWARAILSDAEILLLDEPTASLDAINEAAAQRLLQEECADRIVITVSHRSSAARRADRVILLERGRISATGTHAELLLRSEMYRRLMEHENSSADA